MATLPEGVGLDSTLNYTEKPTNTFLVDWEKKCIVGMDEGLAAMRQAVEIALRVERFMWQIYTSNYGSELDDLPGEEYDYIVGELPRRIEEALSMDQRILSIDDYIFQNNNDGSMTVSFGVETVFGSVPVEVTG